MSYSFALDSDSSKPLYEQLYEALRRSIEDGELKSEDKLPSKRQLSAQLGISQNTVEAAYEQLVIEGYIQSVPRSGFYVSHVMPLEKITRQPVSELAGAPAAETFLFDLKTNTVDTASFPFSTWARLSRRILQDDYMDLLSMTDPQGDLELRQAITRYLHTYRGVNCQADQLVIGAGTEYLLSLIIQLFSRQTLYGIENPGYEKTRQILQSQGSLIFPVDVDAEGLSLEALERSRADIAYITPSHHFPLGIVMPYQRRQAILEWAGRQENRYIIEDDYDSEFRFSGRPIPSLQGLDQREKVIYLGTFSRSIAPSMRISYMVLPRHLLLRYREKLLFYASTVSHFEQRILNAFIREGYFERHLNKMRQIYRSRKELFLDAITSWTFIDQLSIAGSDAGLHLIIYFPTYVSEVNLIQTARKYQIKVYGLNRYFHSDQMSKKEAKPEVTGQPGIILGYAHYDEVSLMEAASRLGEIWKPCICEKDSV